VEKIRIVRTAETDGAALQSGLDRLAASLALGMTDDLLCGVCALVPECVSPSGSGDASAPRSSG
jgi:hypothetical protein